MGLHWKCILLSEAESKSRVCPLKVNSKKRLWGFFTVQWLTPACHRKKYKRAMNLIIIWGGGSSGSELDAQTDELCLVNSGVSVCYCLQLTFHCMCVSDWILLTTGGSITHNDINTGTGILEHLWNWAIITDITSCLLVENVAALFFFWDFCKL